MPELPEVETIRRQLREKIVGKKLDGPPAGEAGKKIVDVRRRAKILIIDFSDGSSLIFHLKLTGQLIFNGESSKHTRHIFKFDDGSRLVFNDIRKFGWWKYVKSSKDIEKTFGPEALEVDLKTFKEVYPENVVDGEIILYKSVSPTNLTDFKTGKIKYEIGKTIDCPDFDPDKNRECGGGLHLSPTPELALNYNQGKLLKCRVKVKDMVIYSKCITKVRCRKVFVEGEV